jgi:hypothetical protein
MGTFDRILGKNYRAGRIDPVIVLRDRTTNYLDATLEDRRIGGHVVKYTPGAALVVLTEALFAGVSHNILEGQIAVVTQIHYGIHTLNDNCHFEIGWTDAVDGGGAFTVLVPMFDYHTAAAQSGAITQGETFFPPPAVWYRDGARSITFRVDANDAGCEIVAHWHGFYITE